MIGKTDKERTAIAKKAWATRRKNSKNFKFTNENGSEKIKRRNEKALAYKKSGLQDGFLLFMPSQTCADVFTINKLVPRNSFKFVGSEINESAIEEIRNKIRKHDLNMFVYPYSIAEIVQRSGENEYAHADFDFCETFSRYHSVLGTAILKNIVKVGGVISVTFAVRDVNIRKHAKKILGRKKFAEEMAKDKPCLIKPTLKKFVRKVGGYSYQFIGEPKIYSDSAIGNHMVFAMIKRVK